MQVHPSGYYAWKAQPVSGESSERRILPATKLAPMCSTTSKRSTSHDIATAISATSLQSSLNNAISWRTNPS